MLIAELFYNQQLCVLAIKVTYGCSSDIVVGFFLFFVAFWKHKVGNSFPDKLNLS